MFKHTPAPWKVIRLQATEDTHHHEVLARDSEYHREVVVCECFPINDDGQVSSESAANARLIAAAPDLLEALKAAEVALTDFSKDGYPVNVLLAEISAAILKAEG